MLSFLVNLVRRVCFSDPNQLRSIKKFMDPSCMSTSWTLLPLGEDFVGSGSQPFPKDVILSLCVTTFIITTKKLSFSYLLLLPYLTLHHWSLLYFFSPSNVYTQVFNTIITLLFILTLFFFQDSTRAL